MGEPGGEEDRQKAGFEKQLVPLVIGEDLPRIGEGQIEDEGGDERRTDEDAEDDKQSAGGAEKRCGLQVRHRLN